MKQLLNLYAASSPTMCVVRVVAALVCAGGLNLGLLALFGQASAQRWLNPTPLVLQAQARCEALPARAARDRCTQDLVARALTPGVQTAQANSR